MHMTTVSSKYVYLQNSKREITMKDSCKFLIKNDLDLFQLLYSSFLFAFFSASSNHKNESMRKQQEFK